MWGWGARASLPPVSCLPVYLPPATCSLRPRLAPWLPADPPCSLDHIPCLKFMGSGSIICGYVCMHMSWLGLFGLLDRCSNKMNHFLIYQLPSKEKFLNEHSSAIKLIFLNNIDNQINKLLLHKIYNLHFDTFTA